MILDYDLVIDWLYNRIPSYENNGIEGYKRFNKRIDLETISHICNHIGNPQDKIKLIHVAGTNGKGSVCNMMASILFERGLKVGLYTSPHIFDFRERIKINGQFIDNNFVIDFVRENKDMLIKFNASFFEVTVAMMFQYFYSHNVDIAVIETGLGGRLDSTNIIKPIISIITNISNEHQDILGHNIRDIASEKAGIIKESTPVILGQIREDLVDIFVDMSKMKNSDVYFSNNDRDEYFEYDINYYNLNKKTVLKSVEVLNTIGYDIKSNHIENGFVNMKKNTSFFGRWEKIDDNPSIIFDVAHNESAINMLNYQLKNLNYNQLHIVFALSKDKNITNIFNILPQNAKYYFSKPKYRCIDVDALAYEAKKNNLIYKTFFSPKESFENANKYAGKEDIILVTGSNFLISEL